LTAEQSSHPVYTEIFAGSLAKALELPDEALPQMTEAVKVLQMGAQSLMESAVPALVHSYIEQMFPSYLESFAPGLQESFRQATVDNIWTETIESDEFKDLGLAKFGTPEFQEAAKRVHEQNPWLNDFDPPGPDGKPLPVMQALRIKAAVTARLLAGERISPKQVLAQVSEALAKGKSEAERHARRVSASRTMGTGRTAAGATESRRENSIMAAYLSRKGGF
jgi:hypothetical protein